MKSKILMTMLCIMPTMAGAAIPYRTELSKSSSEYSGLNQHRFYVGGAYDFSMWQSFTNDADISVSGKNTSGFDLYAGMRFSDTFRIEANYMHAKARWGQFSTKNDAFLLNAIIDARIDSIYSLFQSQAFVPYIGIGAGASWNKSDDDIVFGNKVSPIVSAIAGVSVEFNNIFALDFGYKYLYMFNPDINVIADLNPAAHQFRVGARISF